MAEQIKQRFNAKAEIGIDEIEDDDIGIMTHKPNTLEGGDRKFRFVTLFNWIKGKLLGVFATKEELERIIDDSTVSENKTWSSEKINANLNFLYPIGSLYWNTTPTNPSELFGGTWEQIKDKFILAAGDDYVASETGGSSTVTLKEENLPAHAHGMEHSHNVSGTAKSNGSHSHALLVYTGGKVSISNVYGYSLIASNRGLSSSHEYIWNPQYDGSGTNYIKDNGSHTHELTASTSSISTSQTEPSGSGEAIGILPPYEVAYCWKRIA